MLINNFVLNTTSFLNNFTDVCEKKLSGVSGKLSELEILLAVLEAKLDSIPSIDDGDSPSAPIPATGDAEAGATAASVTAAPVATNDAAPASAPAADAAPAVDSGMIAVKDHPDYKPFAKLLKVGVPLQAAKNKLSAAGLNLDPEMLNDPDQMIPVDRATSTLLVAVDPAEEGAEPEENSMALTVVD